MEFVRRHPYLVLPFGAVCVAIGVMAGWWAFASEVDACNGYSFINKEIPCKSEPVISKGEYKTTRATLAEYLEGERRAGRIADASVYFRDLDNGPTFGINELEEFAPASLLKLPLAVVYLESIDANPALGTAKMQPGDASLVGMQDFRPSESALDGRPHTVEELLRMMIAFSDNASYELLERFVREDPARDATRLRVFQELGIIDPKNRTEEAMTVRNYASLIRILFNHSYLSAASSEKLLAWMAESDFDQGIVAGVPEDIAVAHKFGERTYPDGSKQLQDCGVVYYPDNPYLLCVMVQGSEWAQLGDVIASTSKMVYGEVRSRRR